MLDSMKWVSVCVPLSHLVIGAFITPSCPPYSKSTPYQCQVYYSHFPLLQRHIRKEAYSLKGYYKNFYTKEAKKKLFMILIPYFRGTFIIKYLHNYTFFPGVPVAKCTCMSSNCISSGDLLLPSMLADK